MTRYILVADEMGTPGIAPGVSNTFAFGGYVVTESDLPLAIAAWQRIKVELCGNADVELKWKHFFVNADDLQIPTPLTTQNTHSRRQLAALVLHHLFRESPIVPVVAVSRKDRATETFIVQSKKGNDKIDDDLMWFGLAGQFAQFLTLKRATGKLCFDRLGSEKHEARRQTAWANLLRQIRAEELPPQVLDNLRKLLAIDEQIAFLDSRTNEAIQIAEFTCGVIWQAAEGDEAYLARFITEYGPNATKQGLGILHIA
jgi:hypothetical protein